MVWLHNTRTWQGLVECLWGTQPGAAYLVLQDVECHGVLPLLLSTSREGVCCTEQRMGWLARVQSPFHQPAPTLFAFRWPVKAIGKPTSTKGSGIPEVLPWPLLSLLCSLRAVDGGRGPAELASLSPISAFSQQLTDLSEDGTGECVAGSSPSAFRRSSF